MTSATHSFSVATHGFSDIHNLSDRVRGIIRDAGLRTGLVTVFLPGSTAGITTIEYESGALNDLKRAIERLAPQTIPYEHDARWGDGNGFAHVRAALLGPSLTVPVSDGVMQLGTWQQIVLIDFDNRPRQREVLVHLLGA